MPKHGKYLDTELSINRNNQIWTRVYTRIEYLNIKQTSTKRIEFGKRIKCLFGE